MNYIIVFDHPYTLSSSQNVPHRRSYSAAVAQHTIDYLKKAGHSVDVIDLHQDNFDPVMHAADLAAWRTKASLNPQVDDYFDRLKSADEIIFVFPLWWEVMPAMTKGFIDKVFSKNRIVSKHPQSHLAKTADHPNFDGWWNPHPALSIGIRKSRDESTWSGYI